MSGAATGLVLVALAVVVILACVERAADLHRRSHGGEQ